MISEIIYLHEGRKDVTLTTYITAEKGQLHAVGKRPAVLVCPGGGYMSCADTEAEPVALRFLSMGYQAFVLRYSNYGEGKDGFWEHEEGFPVKEMCLYPVQIREVGKVMMMLREKQEEWQVDPEKIILCGFSAGAHTAALYASKWHTDVITEYFHEDAKIFRPAAVILGYVLCDYVDHYENTGELDEIGKRIAEMASVAFLGTREPGVEQKIEVSPNRNVTKYFPPAYLWATSEDSLVPVQNSLKMALALADYKIPFEMHIFEEGPHGLSLADQSSALAREQIFPDAAKWTVLADAWLKKRFELPLPQKQERRGE